jgi:hypothetical protein
VQRSRPSDHLMVAELKDVARSRRWRAERIRLEWPLLEPIGAAVAGDRSAPMSMLKEYQSCWPSRRAIVSTSLSKQVAISSLARGFIPHTRMIWSLVGMAGSCDRAGEMLVIRSKT